MTSTTVRLDYRVFISYSKENEVLVDRIKAILKESGLTPIEMRAFKPGFEFRTLIERGIAHSHLFMPIITDSSLESGWVQQEIGFAQALHLPILPVCLDTVPPAMILPLHAITLKSGIDDINPNILQEKFESTIFEDAIQQSLQEPRPFFECAMQPETRGKLLTEYARAVEGLGFFGEVRQKGLLSSFHLPDAPVSEHEERWIQRYGRVPRSFDQKQTQLNERLALTRHARKRGCRLMINPYYLFDEFGKEARRYRLQELIDFLVAMENAPSCVVAAIDEAEYHRAAGRSRPHSTTIVGDWFMAESMVGTVGVGYYQTIFTRYAPYVQQRTEDFDAELNKMLKARGWDLTNSREASIELLTTIRDGIVLP